MKIGVVTFPGSNCNMDMVHALNHDLGYEVVELWHKDSDLQDVDAVILPGGFSYGDYLRSGAIARFSNIMEEVVKFAGNGGKVLGICNGFQILVESGLLPGVLLKNDSLNFMCEWTNLIVENNNTPFTNQFELNQKIPIPIANGEGRYYVDDDTLKKLEKNNQIVFKYDQVVNGSLNQIAGVCNEDGNVVGMMPHPERAVESEINPQDNKPSTLIFESLLKKAGVEN